VPRWSGKSGLSTARRGHARLVTTVIAWAAAGLAAGAALQPAGHAQAEESVPVNLTPPKISGTPEVGALLKASTGTWSGSPTSYVYHWLRCNAVGRECKFITGAKASTYTVASIDAGATLRVRVVAINAVGRSKSARSAPTEIIRNGGEVRRLEYILAPGIVRVYSIDQSFAEVESFALPDSAGVRGVNVCPAKHAMYVSYGGDGGNQGNGSVLAYDLVEKKLLWNRSYGNGIDYPALTHDCSRLFEPTGENSSNGVWWKLSTANGEQVAKVETEAKGPHDTVTSADGSLILLGGHYYNRLPIYSSAKGAVQLYVGPLAGGVRPLTIDGLDSAVFTTASGFDGFQVSSVKTGEVFYTENFAGSCSGFTTCSHGVSLTPDSREAAVIDVAHKAVQFWDVHGVDSGVAPAHIATVAVTGLSGNESPCAYSCLREGWVQHSYDGRYVFVGDSGDVIESATHKVIAHIAALENTRESIEVDWQGGLPIATSERLGVGRTG
jgi:hypothetical protein